MTLRRADFDALLEDLEDTEDRNAVLEHDLAVARGETPALTVEEDTLRKLAAVLKVDLDALVPAPRSLFGAAIGLLAHPS